MLNIFNKKKQFKASPETTLSYSNGAAYDYFGTSIALSGDGYTLAVGAPYDTSVAYQVGSITIYRRVGTTWVEQANLTNNIGNSQDQVGQSVALNYDGTTLAAGTGLGNYVLIFTRTNNTWSQQVKLIKGDVFQSFGQSVSLSNDGNTLAVGAPQAPKTIAPILSSPGACFIYTRSGTTWTEEATLYHSAPVNNDKFGQSVSLSGNGNTLAVGSPDDDIGAILGQGSCTIFTRTSNIWSQQSFLTYTPSAANNNFGHSVSLSNDGMRVAVGIPFHSNTSTNNGGCAIYTFINSSWTLEQFVYEQSISNPGGASGDRFGFSVALNSAGNLLIVGIPFDDVSSTSEDGSICVYTRSGNAWSKVFVITNNDGQAGNYFGASVSISNNGNIIAIGEYGKTVGSNTNQGICKVFYRR